MGKGDGFTLIELMVTIAIAAIVLTMGVPSFLSLIQNNRMITVTNDFVTDLNLARSEAIKRSSRVTLCKSADGATCIQEGDWSQGWIVFTDPNDNGDFDGADAGETLLRVHEALSDAQGTLMGNGEIDDYISYVGTGFTRTTTGAFQNGTLILCDDRGFDSGRAIVLNNTGRPATMLASETDKHDCNPSA